jgi:hypothetical protein
MSRFRRPHGLTIWPVLLALVWTAGCARPAGLQSDDAAAHADPHTVPFHDGATAVHPTDNSARLGNSLNPETGLPFQDSKNLPAGTLLTVRLKDPISAENPDANLPFEAIVDEPVVIEGNKLVPRGVTVSGRVESTRASNVRRNRGSVRLTLDSIHLAGATLPIQTSSLFVRGNASDAHVPPGEGPQSEDSPAVIRLEKGRRLTFRLSEPVYVAASQRTQADR